MAKTKVVGLSFKKYSPNEGFQIGEELIISHEKINEFDKNALSVSFNGNNLGYIGKGSDVYDIDRVNFPKSAKIVDFYIKNEMDEKFKQFDEGELVSLNIEIPDEVKLKSKDNVNSFNEEGVVINFNEETHTYTYKGQILKGATTFIKKYIKPFDDEFMVGNCSRAWDVDKSTIKEAWGLAGVLASTFGTGIHKALEFEDLYRSHRKPKDDTRCFVIKHPTIRRIVDEFFELQERLGFEGEVIPEALVSDVENGICGLADRILVTSWEKKTCRIQDYKVNHSFNKKGQETFVNLPDGLVLESTKLSKLSLQLKFHATMLEKQGWTIEGVDGFVYDSEWRYYEANSLDGFNILEGTFN